MAILLIIGMTLAGAVIFQLLGMLWYGPLFGKLWMRSIGITTKTAVGKKEMAIMIAQSTVMSAITSFILLLVAFALPNKSMAMWATVLLVVFAASVSYSSALYEKRSLTGWAIHQAYVLVASVVTVFTLSFILW